MSAETDATPNVVANGDAGAASPKKEASDGCAHAQAILRVWAACFGSSVTHLTRKPPMPMAAQKKSTKDTAKEVRTPPALSVSPPTCDPPRGA